MFRITTETLPGGARGPLPGFCALVARLLPDLKWRYTGYGSVAAPVRLVEPLSTEVRLVRRDFERGPALPWGSGQIGAPTAEQHTVVLAGSVRLVEYDLTPDPDGDWHTWSFNDDGAPIREPDSHYIIGTRGTVVVGGGAFSWPAGVFARMTPGDDRGALLLTTGPAKGLGDRGRRTLGPDGFTPPTKEPFSVDVGEYIQEMTDVLEGRGRL